MEGKATVSRYSLLWRGQTAGAAVVKKKKHVVNLLCEVRKDRE